MTKAEFLSGKCFTIGAPTYKGANTYSYFHGDRNNGCIMRQSRSSLDNRIVLNDYECNAPKIGSKSFTGFTYVLKKKVVVKYRFEDLIVFEETVGE
jgi:hypothetical protein